MKKLFTFSYALTFKGTKAHNLKIKAQLDNLLIKEDQ